MKYCEEFAALLDLYVDGELTGEEAARVREHLAGCPGCQDYVDGALAMRAAFPDAEDTAVPEGFTQEVMARVRELEAARAERSRPGARRYGHWKTVLLPLAACFALVLVLRTVPGGGGGNNSLTAASMAPTAAMDTAAMDTAASAGDSGEYGSAAPRMAAAGDVPAEADCEAVPELRTAMEEPASPDASAPVLGEAAPQAEEGLDVTGTAGKLSGWTGRAIRLTADQAGELLADLPYTAGENGVRCYQLPSADFDALLTALAEQGILPQEEAAELESLPEGYDLVYVTEE